MLGSHDRCKFLFQQNVSTAHTAQSSLDILRKICPGGKPSFGPSAHQILWYQSFPCVSISKAKSTDWTAEAEHSNGFR